jgi:tRNA modification GTPase
VIRLSGPSARSVLKTLGRRVPEPRRASLMILRDPDTGIELDQALVLWLPAPRSETGEDMVELHLHGGRAVVTAVLAALGRVPHLRPAQPGEFTRRAFENGRLDLTAVEGLADLVAAETEAQRGQALLQLQGRLREHAEHWRQRLIDAMALVEAQIDFADEADVPEDLLGPALESVRELRDEVTRALADEGRGERLRDGLNVAVMGPPNAGKSSLINRIARRDAAIVSPYAGTTRDVIEVHLDLAGYPVTVVDTAGIRDSEDPVEQEGVRRALMRAEAADLVLWVVDAREESSIGARGPDRGKAVVWAVINKVDLVTDTANRCGRWPPEGPARGFRISALTGEGVDVLMTALAEWSRNALSGAEPSLVTRERHRIALREVVSALTRASGVEIGRQEDLLAEELRLAARALGRLTGRVDVEDVLDVIFRDFCIGK